MSPLAVSSTVIPAGPRAHQPRGLRLRRSRWRLARRKCARRPSDARTAGNFGSLLALALLWLPACLSLGCVGYQFGPQTLFRPDIRTVYVPVVRNDTFRHDLGVRLTEAVIREIQERTPYVISSDPSADSVLTCRFDAADKRVLTETATDEVRAFDVLVSVQASWVSRRGEILMENQLPTDANVAMLFLQDSRVVPEAGQSVETGLQEAIEDLARRIVTQMEARW